MNRHGTATGRTGTTLVEVTVVICVLGVLLALVVPSYRRAVEQSRAQVAAANLRAIWAAQRAYWLEHQTYAATLSELGPLLDSTTLSSPYYSYTIVSADSSTFTARATRTGSSKWSGQFTIDQTGGTTGAIQAAGEVNIVPGFE